MEIPRLTWSDDDDIRSAVTRALDEAGCCVVERAAPAASMDAIHDELAAFDTVGSIGEAGRTLYRRSNHTPSCAVPM